MQSGGVGPTQQLYREKDSLRLPFSEVDRHPSVSLISLTSSLTCLEHPPFFGPIGLSDTISCSSPAFGTFWGFFSHFVPDGTAPLSAWWELSGAP